MRECQEVLAGAGLDLVSPRDIAKSVVSLLFPFLGVGDSFPDVTQEAVPAVRPLETEVEFSNQE